MKGLVLGILLVIIVGIGGLVYRNAVQYSAHPIACPVAASQCPDGTLVPHLANSCDFPACPPPNVSLSSAGIAFAVPDGFVATTTSDATSIAAYSDMSASTSASITIRRFAIEASSTALATIRQTAISGTSGMPVPITAFSSTILGGTNFTVVTIKRFEGVVDTAYYLSRGTDVLRFDAVDQNVPNWADSSLDISTLPANAALRKLLATLEEE